MEMVLGSKLAWDRIFSLISMAKLIVEFQAFRLYQMMEIDWQLLLKMALQEFSSGQTGVLGIGRRCLFESFLGSKFYSTSSALSDGKNWVLIGTTSPMSENYYFPYFSSRMALYHWWNGDWTCVGPDINVNGGEIIRWYEDDNDYYYSVSVSGGIRARATEVSLVRLGYIKLWMVNG